MGGRGFECSPGKVRDQGLTVVVVSGARGRRHRGGVKVMVRTLVRVVEGARPGKALDDHILNTPPKQVARTGVEYVSVVFAKMLKTR